MTNAKDKTKDNEIRHYKNLSTKDRRQQLARTIEAQPRISVTELSDLFAVSAVTIRKDLTWLEERKFIVRTHGGAVLARPGLSEATFDVREKSQRHEKEQIGRLAAQLVRSGDAIAIDSSTTAWIMSRYLADLHELSVVTNGVPAGMEMSNYPGCSVLMPAGMLRRESLALVGMWGLPVLQQINIRIAFVGARGLSLPEGLTEMSSDEIAFKRAVVEAAHEVVALVDHTKWGHVAFATFCPIERLKLVITDEKAPQEMIDQLRQRGIEVWIASSQYSDISLNHS